jgi:hypothetical protein
MFEDIEKASEGQDEILAPQNHAHPFVSFVWDATDDRAAWDLS